MALSDVNLTINEGEVLGLIGPNGSGKTTLINCITGFYKPTSGKIRFLGKDVTGLKSYTICKRGIARTFQIPRPFLRLTALENVMISTGGDKDLALECIERVRLLDVRDTEARNLTFHQIRMLEIARALGSKPRLILVDEAMAGLNPVEIEEALKLLKEIKETGVTLLWVEHVMKAIMKGADRVAVFNKGEKIAEGKPKQIANDQRVVEAYLGADLGEIM